jgi:transposase
MEDRITLNQAEQRRLLVLNHLEAGALVNAEAAELLGVSIRQVRRLRAAYRERGAAALAHGNRGRRPAHALDQALALRVVELATSTYAGFNHQHLTEMLAEHEGIYLSRPSVHRILTQAGVASVRTRRPARHRRRRERMPREGMLLQIDGSRHDWLEGRGPYLTLIGAVDDATGIVPWACFRDQEDAQGYFQLLAEVVRRRGVPLALYSDQHAIFFVTKKAVLTLEEQLNDRPAPTQFGRLVGELGISLIRARSPQAKGRVERLWGTFQDRLGSELRLAGASDRHQAQIVLERYVARHNRRFAVPAADLTPAWLPWPKQRRRDEVFCFKYRRVVANDNTVHLGNLVIDIPPDRQRISYAHCQVEVQRRFDGTTHVVYEGRHLTAVTDLAADPENYRLLPATCHTPAAAPPSPPRLPSPTASTSVAWKPPKTHPWKRCAAAGAAAKLIEPLAGQIH